MIELKPLSDENISAFYNWINDDEAIKYSLSLFQTISTKSEIDYWYTELINNNDILNYGIFMQSDNRLIGYAGICNIAEDNKSGEFYIFIGDKTMWGKGIATTVAKQVVGIAFDQMNFEQVYLTVSEPNIGGIKAYTKAGFLIKDRLIDACYRDNKYHDKLIMTINKGDITNE